jgi:hypothetical protein
MTIYILYHNTRSEKIPQWNYIPDVSLLLKNWPINAEQFDLRLDSMPNTDVVYAKIEDVPEHSNWLYSLNNLYNHDLYRRSDLTIFDYFKSVPRLMTDLIAGYGRIVYDDRREGYLYSNYVRGEIEGFFKLYGIPLDRVVFATGTANAKEIFDRNGYTVQSVYLQQFELESSWAAQYLSSATPQRRIDRRFLCFNRSYQHRIHRLQLLAKMYRRNLLDQFYYSMLDGVDSTDVVTSAMRVIGIEPDSYDTVGAMQDLKPCMPMLLDTDDLKTNLAWVHTQSVESYYLRTGISVVTETLFHDGEIFFSEKTWHPMRMQQPFILVNGPGSLQHLRDLGYKTFGQWWDESYDTIADSYERLDAIEQLIVDIAQWSDSKFMQVATEAASVCQHNLLHLANAHTRISYTDRLNSLFSGV